MQTTSRVFVRLLLAVGVAALVWAVIGLFNTVEVTELSGKLDSGQPYATTIVTYGLNSLYGLLVLLTAGANLAVAIKIFQNVYSWPKILLWSGFSLILVLGIPFVGATPMISWLPGIPAEIQHGISTPYVRVIEESVMNIPLLVAVGFTVTFIATAALYAVMKAKDS